MRLGIVCGMDRERRCLERGWAGDGAAPVIAVGMGPAAAAAATRSLAALGLDVIASVGMAGGLDPDLEPGALVVPECVADATRSIELDADDLRQELAARGGRLLSVESPLDQPAAKAAAADRGFSIVDMESLAVATVARTLGPRPVVVRAVADPAARCMPRLARTAIGSDGRLRPLAIAAALVAWPSEWPLLRQVARDAAAAEESLGRAAGTLARLAREGRL